MSKYMLHKHVSSGVRVSEVFLWEQSKKVLELGFELREQSTSGKWLLAENYIKIR